MLTPLFFLGEKGTAIVSNVRAAEEKIVTTCMSQRNSSPPSKHTLAQTVELKGVQTSVSATRSSLELTSIEAEGSSLKRNREVGNTAVAEFNIVKKPDTGNY